MPSVVKNNLNQLIRAGFVAAEVIPSPRPFAGLALNNLAGQQVLVSGIKWCVSFGNAADKPNAAPALFIQRSLTLASDTIFPAAEKHDEMIFQLGFDNAESFVGVYAYTRPIVLGGGYSWAVVLNMAPLAAFAGGITLLLTVLGDQVSEQGAGQLPALR